MTRINQLFKLSIISIFILFITFSLVACNNSANVHTYTGWYTSVEATCECEGLEKRICLDCDSVEERVVHKTDHNETGWITQFKATCQTQGKMIKKCTMCNKVTQTMFLEKTDHEYDNNWLQVKAPTAEKTGRAARKCKHCDFYQYKEILFQQ